MTCAWCSVPIGQGEPTRQIAFQELHPSCADAFDAFVYGGENDLRWRLVTDDTPVCFDGELCRWGDLMLADRKTVDMLPDGRLVGGYPF